MPASLSDLHDSGEITQVAAFHTVDRTTIAVLLIRTAPACSLSHYIYMVRHATPGLGGQAHSRRALFSARDSVSVFRRFCSTIVKHAIPLLISAFTLSC